MRILALVVARGNSKRLPGKNIRLLGGRPLIMWSIDAAKDSVDICDILVSTDDQKIATICQEAGAYVPWLRPSELATDTASTVDVVLHALDWYENEKGKVDGVLLLQPTSPFRKKNKIKEGIELFIQSNLKTVMGVSPTHNHPMWTFKIQNNYLVPFTDAHGFEMRSQDLPPAYVVNGSFYLISPIQLRRHLSFISDEVIPLFAESPEEGLDIDTGWDFKLAEFLLDSKAIMLDPQLD
jgi:CMP-N,N'-diacetyllegionaminic acid synthase